MLSYQHGYHAGSFADVIKHLTLIHILEYLTQKDKPLFYLETHSGKGMYDLYSNESKKTNEFKSGIEIIWENRKELPRSFTPYLQQIDKLNQDGKLRMYPGSPYLALQLLRPQDRMYACELHPREFEQLSTLRRLGIRAHFSESDGMLTLNSLLPPPEKRGLIFIDPAYENKDEYADIPKLIKKAYTHFNTGVYCLWYPVVDKKLTERLLRHMKSIQASKCLNVEINLKKPGQFGMTGCGLFIINPPFILSNILKEVLENLKNQFGVETRLEE